MSFSIGVDLVITDAELVGINELGLAFGSVPVMGTLRVRYKVLNSTSIQVDEINANGSFDDLYDFFYNPTAVGSSRARSASIVQAGHTTLSTPATPSGRIFFTRLEFDTGWKAGGGTYP